MLMLYSVGGNTAPCGTPARTGRVEERAAPLLTWNVPSSRKDFSNSCIGLGS